MNKSILIIVGILLTSGLIFSLRLENDADEVTNLDFYYDYVQDVSFLKPEGWEALNYKNNTLILLKGDDIQYTVLVTNQTASLDQTLAEFILFYQLEYIDFKLIQNEETQINNLTMKRFMFSKNQGEFYSNNIQYLTNYNNKTYVITFTKKGEFTRRDKFLVDYLAKSIQPIKRNENITWIQ